MNHNKKLKDFHTWLNKFEISDLGGSALNRLKKKFSKDSTLENFERLHFMILKNCYFAKTYNIEKDPNEILRKSYEISFSKDLKSTINNIAKIRRFIKNYPNAASWAMLQAYYKLNDKNCKIYSDKEDKDKLHEILNVLLEGFSEGLSQPIPGVKSGPWLHRWAIGPLLYPDRKPLDQQSQRPKDIVLSGLAFILVSIFREHTNNWKGDWRNLGRSMPEYGKPKIPLVVDFLNATLNLSLEEKNVKDIIKQLVNLNVTINRWPHEKGVF